MNASLLRLLTLTLGLSQLVIGSVTRSSDIKLHNFHKRSQLALQKYEAFQISTGPTGKCATNAAAVFLKPYNLTLSSMGIRSQKGGSTKAKFVAIPFPIDQSDQSTCRAMAKLASNAENQFNLAITNAQPNATAVAALEAGKTCNKVLKFTGQVLCLQIDANLRSSNSMDQQNVLKTASSDLKASIDADLSVQNVVAMATFIK